MLGGESMIPLHSSDLVLQISILVLGDKSSLGTVVSDVYELRSCWFVGLWCLRRNLAIILLVLSCVRDWLFHLGRWWCLRHWGRFCCRLGLAISACRLTIGSLGVHL